MIRTFLAAVASLLVAGAAWAEGKPAGGCSKPAFMVALDAIDLPDADVKSLAPSGIRELMLGSVKDGFATLVLDRMPPDRIYEKSATWKEIVITRWDCVEDLTAFWKAKGASVKAPTDANRLFSVGVFEDAPPMGEIPADMVPPNCASPVYLIGANTVLDPVKYAAYTKALGASQLTARHGFKRVFAGAPKEQLAGSWPANTTVTLSTWPCLESFEKFHYSDAYHKDLMPQRLASARYRLILFTATQ